MGISIELNKCNFNLLTKTLCDAYKIEDKELLEKILLQFGELIEDTYVIMHNEYWIDGTCTYNCFELIDKVFKIDGSYSVFLDIYEKMIDYKEIDDAIDELGLEDLIEEDDEEVE